MIIGFSRHSKGRGRGPVDYYVNEKRQGRENSPPVVLRGSPEATENLIDSLDFKHRYTSGVLSFAPDEKVTPEQENAIMDRFESVAFAGLEPDQYNILWVRHSHADHHELHFVTPRIELSTGKSLNIRPPGDGTKRLFDDLRSEINAKYGFADPDDPARARNVSVPDNVLKNAAEQLRRGETPETDIRVALDEILSQRAIQGVIRSRDDLTAQIREMGFEVPREGKNYITVLEPESGSRWRMKGALYEREFDVSRAIEEAAARRTRDYSKPDEIASERYSQRLEEHIKHRAEYNQKSYCRRFEHDYNGNQNRVQDVSDDDKRRVEEVAKNVNNRNAEDTVELSPQSSVDPVPHLDSYLSERLNCYALLHEQLDRRDQHIELANYSAESAENRAGEESRRLDETGVRSSIHEMWPVPPPLRQSGPECGNIPGRQPEFELDDIGEITHDRVRNTLIERLKGYVEDTQRASESFRARAQNFTENVRAYFAGQRDAIKTSKILERTSERISEPLQAEQTLRNYQEEQDWQRAAARPAPKKYYGPSM